MLHHMWSVCISTRTKLCSGCSRRTVRYYVPLAAYAVRGCEVLTAYIPLGGTAFCKMCGAAFTTERLVHSFCSIRCRKSFHQKQSRKKTPVNSVHSRSKLRENTEIFDTALCMTESYYNTHPFSRHKHIEELIQHARADSRTRAILSNQYLRSDDFQANFLKRRGFEFSIATLVKDFVKSHWGVSLKEAFKRDFSLDPTAEKHSRLTRGTTVGVNAPQEISRMTEVINALPAKYQETCMTSLITKAREDPSFRKILFDGVNYSDEVSVQTAVKPSGPKTIVDLASDFTEYHWGVSLKEAVIDRSADGN